jgi:hypothetical protein
MNKNGFTEKKMAFGQFEFGMVFGALTPSKDKEKRHRAKSLKKSDFSMREKKSDF